MLREKIAASAPRGASREDLRTTTVSTEQIDGIDLQSLERALGDLLGVFWPTVEANPLRPAVGIEFESELGGYHHLPAERSKGFAHEFSFVNGPYTSAVSKNVTPRSTADRINVIPSCLSTAGPYPKLIPMQPRPIADTSKLLFSEFALLHCHLLRLAIRQMIRPGIVRR